MGQVEPILHPLGLFLFKVVFFALPVPCCVLHNMFNHGVFSSDSFFNPIRVWGCLFFTLLGGDLSSVPTPFLPGGDPSSVPILVTPFSFFYSYFSLFLV
jgi:hypothetical protein